MNFYKQPIIIFGTAIPVLLALVLVAVGYIMKSKMTTSYEIKKVNYVAHSQDRLAAVTVEGKVKEQRDDLQRWNEQLSKETASAIGINLREITENLPNKEIQQTAFDPSNSSTGIGTASAQEASQVRIGFRGTFRTLQKAFLELETRMPHLQLEDMKLEPVSTSAYLLNLQLTYSAWENR